MQGSINIRNQSVTMTSSTVHHSAGCAVLWEEDTASVSFSDMTYSDNEDGDECPY